MIHRVHQLAASVAIVALVAGACSSSATPAPTAVPSVAAPSAAASVAAPSAAPSVAPSAAASPSAAALTVVVIPKQINNPYFDVAFKGAQKAATDLGGTVTQVGPSAADATQQVPFIQTATTQGVSAIVISADDATAVAPALQAAMAAGVKVVGYDSSPAVGAYNVFVNQADTAGIGKGLADMACDEAPNCTGEIAVLSAAQSATNQNAWIGYMKKELKKYPKMTLVSTVYGNDDPTTATQVTQGLLEKYPSLGGIISPTTVGIVAAAGVLDTPKYRGKIALTGLGTPDSMKKYVADGTVQAFELWNPASLGFLAAYAAVNLASSTITNASGQTFTAGKLGSFTVGADHTVLLGKPFVFNKGNISQFNF